MERDQNDILEMNSLCLSIRFVDAAALRIESHH